MREASLAPLVKDLIQDSYGSNYRNDNISIMQGNWWSFWQNRNTVNTELGALRMERDERDVQMILKCLKNWTPNMWHADQPTSNIATGKIATEAMNKNILSLKE